MLPLTWLFPGFALLALLTAAVLGVCRQRPAQERVLRSIGLFASVMTACAGFWYLLSMLCYLVHDGYVDHIEPSIAAQALNWLHGGELYHAPEAGERYNLPYGPALFAVHAVVFRLLGPTMGVSKVAGATAALLIPLLFHWLARRHAPPAIARLGTGLLLLTLLLFGPLPFGNRADPLILLCVTIALVAQELGAPAGRFGICSLALGAAISLKLHAILYFIPLFALRSPSATGWRDAGALPAGLCLAAAPFALFPTISLSQFLWILGSVSQHGFDGSLALQGVGFALFLASLPLAFGGLRFLPRAFPIVAGVALAPVLIVSMKAGAGPVHLLPFLPLTLFVAVRGMAATSPLHPTSRRGEAALGLLFAYFFTGAGFAIVNQQYFWGMMLQNIRTSPHQEIQEILAAHPGERVSMGYGSRDPLLWRSPDYRLSLWHPIVVMAGHPHLFDLPAIMDMNKAGLDMPGASIDLMRAGRVTLWIIPRGATPFALHNIYEPHSDLFGNAFRAAFRQHYRLATHTEHFDLWNYIANDSFTP